MPLTGNVSPSGAATTERPRLLLLCNGTEQETTGRLCMALARNLERHFAVRLRLRSFPTGILRKIPALVAGLAPRIPDILWADAIIVHTTFSLSLIDIVLARILGKKVYSLVWDIYPESFRIHGNISNPVLIGIQGLIEHLGYRLSTKMFVPSEDYIRFLPGYAQKKATVMPLWTTDPVADVPAREVRDELRVVFAGQINVLRSLTDAFQCVLGAVSGPIEAHLFSRDPAPDDLLGLAEREGRLMVSHHGFVSAEELQPILRTMDFGLVALVGDYNLPAFPSKIMAYAAAGLPILYSGPQSNRALADAISASGIGLVLDSERKMSKVDLEIFLREYPEKRDRFLEASDRGWEVIADIH